VSFVPGNGDGGCDWPLAAALAHAAIKTSAAQCLHPNM
jgi:hypothetical protein